MYSTEHRPTTMQSYVSLQNGDAFGTVSQSYSMEPPVSQCNGSLFDVVSECESIDVVTESPINHKKKVKIVEPWEFLKIPKIDDNKRECRPYKGILKHLSSYDSEVLERTEQCTETSIESALPPLASPSEWHPLSPEIPTCNQVQHELQELQTFPMTKQEAPNAGAIVPYVGLAGDSTPFFIPGSGFFLSAATGEMPAHQIHTPGSGLPQGIVVAASSTDLHIPQQLAEEATRKREMRLMKNREAAKACRLRRKEYIRCLENHNAMLEGHIKELMQELEIYRNMYSHSATRTTS
ncbi:cAMP-responsive element modulator isoform 1-T1 [Anomaloglossus baeobatrachus]|uniref:cAMP-responsive element modulator isoform X3 n=1 Tax=Anomaloglossus baeobatrachus TaxID=238106 RepID=UPI003F4F415C